MIPQYEEVKRCRDEDETDEPVLIETCQLESGKRMTELKISHFLK